MFEVKLWFVNIFFWDWIWVGFIEAECITCREIVDFQFFTYLIIYWGGGYTDVLVASTAL